MYHIQLRPHTISECTHVDVLLNKTRSTLKFSISPKIGVPIYLILRFHSAIRLALHILHTTCVAENNVHEHSSNITINRNMNKVMIGSYPIRKVFKDSDYSINKINKQKK